MESRSGFIGSLVVHLGVIGGAVAFAFMRPSPVEEVGAQDVLLLDVWQGDGSERDPGIPGKERGAAEGKATGDKSKVGLGGLPAVKSLNANKLIKEMKEADRRAAAEAAAAEKAAAEKAAQQAAQQAARPKAEPTSSGSGKTSDKKSSPKESLADFMKANGNKAGKGTTSPGSSGSGKPTGASNNRAGAGSSGGTGTGNGKGADGFGRAGGTRANGGDGGSGREDLLFSGDVQGKFADVFIPLFRDEGGGASLDYDSAVVEVLVSSSGNVSFSGWASRPSSDVVERLVREAIRRMPPVRRPPGGKAILVQIPLKTRVTD